MPERQWNKEDGNCDYVSRHGRVAKNQMLILVNWKMVKCLFQFGALLTPIICPFTS